MKMMKKILIFLYFFQGMGSGVFQKGIWIRSEFADDSLWIRSRIIVREDGALAGFPLPPARDALFLDPPEQKTDVSRNGDEGFS